MHITRCCLTIWARRDHGREKVLYVNWKVTFKSCHICVYYERFNTTSIRLNLQPWFFLNCWERKVPNMWPSDVRAGQWCAGDDFFFFESPCSSIDVLQNRVLSVFEFHGDIQNGLIRAAYIITSIHKCSPCVSKCINYSLKDNCRTSILIFEKKSWKVIQLMCMRKVMSRSNLFMYTTKNIWFCWKFHSEYYVNFPHYTVLAINKYINILSTNLSH